MKSLLNRLFFKNKLFPIKDELKGEFEDVLFYRSYEYEYVYIAKRGTVHIYVVPIQDFFIGDGMFDIKENSLFFLEFDANKELSNSDDLIHAAFHDRPTLGVMF